MANAEYDLSKARVFFEKGQNVAEKGNFDYAIDMFLDGLRCAPDAVMDGHVKLRELALLRAQRGGKKPGMMEKMKLRSGKTPVDHLLTAEYLFAKDPSNLSYAETMLKAAVAADLKNTAIWIADLLFQASNATDKPSASTYLLLKDSYKKIGQFDRALLALQYASKLRPVDSELSDEFKNLSAELAVSRGKYDIEGDFRKSIKDKEAQEELVAQESVVKSEDYRILAIEAARKKHAQEPDVANNIFSLADALATMDDDAGENEAIELLERKGVEKKDFGFKKRAGEIRIKQIKRQLRAPSSALSANPQDPQARKKVVELSKQLQEARLQHFRLCVENYPTDLAMKYEYANSLLDSKNYDEAIPLFQEAQKDPRRKTTAHGKIGYCFFYKGWYTDAIDIFNQAIEEYEIKDDAVAKELRYNLARAYQEDGDGEKALEIFRKLAQLDFSYKDVRKRIDELRAKQKE